MSMNCFGCDYYSRTKEGYSFCEYYQETKHNMDRERSVKYVPFQHGHCSHDTRRELSDEDGET